MFNAAHHTTSTARRPTAKQRRGVSVEEILKSDAEMRRGGGGRSLQELLAAQRLRDLEVRRKEGGCGDKRETYEALCKAHPHLAADTSLRWSDQYASLSPAQEAERRAAMRARLLDISGPDTDVQLEMYRTFVAESIRIINRDGGPKQYMNEEERQQADEVG